jgi:hypothetical protein
LILLTEVWVIRLKIKQTEHSIKNAIKQCDQKMKLKNAIKSE